MTNIDRKKIYIAGPMTGIKDFNKPAFVEAANFFRVRGHHVFNPGEIDGEGRSYRSLFAQDMEFLLHEADAVYFLPGWEHSLGARAEHTVATALKLNIYYQTKVGL